MNGEPMVNENNLKRFLDAQQPSYAMALSEIQRGKKETHWMWFIFPQIQGLGLSETSKYYAIQNMREAGEFLQHPVLGTRLVKICNELLKLESNNANKIFGSPDDLKLKSSMTLFSSLQGADPVFQFVLEKFFSGAKDSRTIELIGMHG